MSSKYPEGLSVVVRGRATNFSPRLDKTTKEPVCDRDTGELLQSGRIDFFGGNEFVSIPQGQKINAGDDVTIRCQLIKTKTGAFLGAGRLIEHNGKSFESIAAPSSKVS